MGRRETFLNGIDRVELLDECDEFKIGFELNENDKRIEGLSLEGEEREQERKRDRVD